MQMVRNEDVDAGGPTPVKEEDAVMRRLYPLNCRQYF